MGWGWLEGARATGSCKARPGLRGTDSHRQRPGGPGAGCLWACPRPATRSGQAVCAPTPRAGLKPQRAAAAVGAGAHPGGNRAPLLPDCPSRVRCWPCPWRSHCHLVCTAAAQPPRRLPPSGGWGWSVCCENPGPGEQRVARQAGTSEVLGQLPGWAPGWPLPAPAPATLGPFAERSREQAGPRHISAQRAVLGAAVCHLRAPVCSRRTQSPTSGLTALAEDAPVLCSQTFPRFYF